MLLTISAVCLQAKMGLVNIKSIFILNFFIEFAILFISEIPTYVSDLPAVL